ncbi:MAG: trypsin-like serine protease [Marinobacterium sp.]|nr:trypsin-like serine protease [Marinobacterium sp.]
MTTPDTHYPAVFQLLINHADNNSGISTGSAVLLAGGRYLLTAAHLVSGVSNPDDLRLRSQDLATLPDISTVYIHPEWDADNYNNDIALLELATPITEIAGLNLYQGPTPLGEAFVRVGFGNGFNNPQHIGTNQWDSPGTVLNTLYQRDIPDGSQLLYDYDNGSQAQNMLGQLPDSQSNAQPTSHETLALAGDSGGPALVNGQVAGIASYVVADSKYDSDPNHPSSPGESGADSNIAAYRSWIDYITQGNPVYQPPQTAASVITQLPEPDYGSIINHFLLSVSQPQSVPITLWYETLDGSARAGEDYIASSGWVTLQPGQTSISIAVEILGDRNIETDEAFWLKLSDPSQQWLASGQILTALHSITDNDALPGDALAQ